MEPEILARLIDRHAAALVLYARQWCAAADDVVQEALVKLAAQSPDPDNVPAWLFRTVRNGAISAARPRAGAAVMKLGRPVLPTGFRPMPRALVDASEAAQALGNLALEEREVIVAHLWGGLTFEQVAELAGCSASTAHRRYQAGLARLRQLLGEPCPNTNLKATIDSKPPSSS